MRPERVRRFPEPVQVSSFGRRPQAANDNEPAHGESVVSIVIGRSLLVGAALLAVSLVLAWGVWLLRTIGRQFA